MLTLVIVSTRFSVWFGLACVPSRHSRSCSYPHALLSYEMPSRATISSCAGGEGISSFSLPRLGRERVFPFWRFEEQR
jgi:hypothetical protein